MQNKKAFTLVELIVSIVILAILGTIAFISIQSYSASSRDGVRISDLGKVKTGLELYMVDSGKYPLPTNGVDITYLSGTVWTQGTYGEQTNANVDKLSKLPLDPLTESKYTYSITSRGNEYELSGIVEGDEVGYRPIPNPPLSGEGITALLNQTNAGEIIVKAIVTGTYNGKITKTTDGTLCSLLAVPTIIVSDTTEYTDLEELSANKKFVYNGQNNLPSSYIGSKFDNNGGFDFEPNNLLLYSDNLGCSVLENNETERVILLKKLQESYSGTLLETEGDYKELMDINIDLFAPNNSSKLISRSIMTNDLGLRLSEESLTYLNCESGEVNGYTYENIAHSLGKNVTKTGTISYGTQNYGAQAICDNGIVTIKNESINTICNSGYVEQGGACVEDKCNGTIPINGVSTATSQSVNTTWTYNLTTPGQCTFKCDTNYVYNSGTNTCNAGTQNTNCTSLPTNAVWNTTNNITQTWNGTTWLPLEIGSYNPTASTTTCNFKCETNYTWNGTNSCTDQTGPVISIISSSSPSCETIRYTITASDSIGLNASAYSFDGGNTWQSGNTKDYSSTSLTKSSTDFKVRDSAGNITTYTSDVSGTSSSCYTYSWYSGGRSSCSASSYWGSRGSCSVSCGGGTMYRYCQQPGGSKSRTVYCSRNDGTQVSDGYCTGTKPTSSTSCTADLSGCSRLSSQSTSCNTSACGPAMCSSYSARGNTKLLRSYDKTTYYGTMDQCRITCKEGGYGTWMYDNINVMHQCKCSTSFQLYDWYGCVADQCLLYLGVCN